ncbi:hypothetical protein AC629_37630, partial [Bradyrhizobium sp. NAS80.1]|uniref:hypothetical protein n=1 Tax=Bradyrhizobium sp. NAS80.1 TaxID=1680159 RepID=UPI00095A2F0F
MIPRIPRSYSQTGSDNVATPQATVSAHIAGQIANMKNVGLLRAGDVLYLTKRRGYRVVCEELTRRPGSSDVLSRDGLDEGSNDDT